MSYQPVASCDDLCCTPVTNAPMPAPERTIQANLMSTTEDLECIEATIDTIIRFIWCHDDVNINKTNDIEIHDMDSNIVCNMDKTRRIREKLNGIAARLGC